MDSISIIQVVDGFLHWMSNTDLVGYDPYDIKSSKIGLWLENNNDSLNLLGRSLNLSERHFPRVSRIFVKKTKSSTAVSLFTSSCFLLYEIRKDKRLLKKAEKQLDWLEKNSSTGYSGFCWGLPFDWLLPGNILARKSTPCSTIMLYMVDAFMLGYELTKKEKYLKIANSAVNFFLNDLNKDIINNNMICLSYTPLDRFHVINVNAYVAATLYKIHKYDGKNKKLIDFANKLINYVLNEQNNDGSWYYWGVKERRNGGIDSLHQCYIIENLYRCYLFNKDRRILKSITKALTFYINNFFINGNIKKLPFLQTYVHPDELIDHAEAIYMFAMLWGRFDTEQVLSETLKYTLKTFKIQDKPYFYSYILGDRKIDIPYMRWGQTQMLYSLVFYLMVINKVSTVEKILCGDTL